MRFSAIVASSALVASALAAPQRPGFGGGHHYNRPRCLTKQDADAMGEIFRGLITAYTDELALEGLTEDFVDWSSSVNILMNKGGQYPKNITGPTFDSRQTFMDGQGSQPLIPFEILNLFYGCDSVTVRWMTTRSAAGKPTEAAAIPAVGNGIMYVVPADDNSYGWRIKELFSEFNTGAWFVNLGWFVPNAAVDYLDAPNSTNATAKREVGADERWWQNVI